MRVLHVVQRYWPYTGGSERHLQAISERLVRDGHQVAVWTTDAWDLELFWDRRRRRVPGPVDEHNGVRIRRFPVRHLPGGPLAYPIVRRLLVELARLPVVPERLLVALSRQAPRLPEFHRALRAVQEVDLIAAMNICFEGLGWSALRAARRLGVPFVYYPLTHLGEPERATVRRYYTMRHQLALLRACDAVLAQTEGERTFLVERGVTPERIVLAGPGVDPAPAARADAARFRAATGLEGPIVTFLGTAAYDKGAIHLIEAMRRLWAEGREVALVLAGPRLAHVDAYLARLSPAERRRCHCLGFIPEEQKWDLLAATTVLALPSRTDSFGIVFLEAWLLEKPVIGARAGGIPDVVADGQTGLLVRFGDVGGLAAALRRLLEDPVLARALGAAGRARVLAHHTWDHVYERVRAVYERLARGR